MKKLIWIISVMLISATNSFAQQKEFPKLTGPYLGQKPPGMTPEMFAPGIISKRLSVHSSPCFSPDKKEVYWTVMNNQEPMRIVFMKEENGFWTQPQKVSFTGEAADANPFFSTNGRILFFKSLRGNISALWKTERENGTWSDPQNLGSPFSSTGLAWQASVTRDGVIYFVKSTSGFGSHDIYKARRKNRTYGLAEKIAPPVNSTVDDWQVFIEPDEEYIIFGRYQKPNHPLNGLYVSFLNKNGNWTEPIRMGKEINGDHGAYWPYVSPDKKYLFFVSDMDNGNWHYDVYWVNAKIIEELKPKGLK